MTGAEKTLLILKTKNDWTHIETSEKKIYGIVGDYYLCKKCSDAFYKFLDNEYVEVE